MLVSDAIALAGSVTGTVAAARTRALSRARANPGSGRVPYQRVWLPRQLQEGLVRRRKLSGERFLVCSGASKL